MSHQFEALLQKYHVQHRVASPYHPQASGQVESTKKSLKLSSPRRSRAIVEIGLIDFWKHYGNIAPLGITLQVSLLMT